MRSSCTPRVTNLQQYLQQMRKKHAIVWIGVGWISSWTGWAFVCLSDFCYHLCTLTLKCESILWGSSPFLLHKDTRQCCRLSPLWLNIATEPLSCMLDCLPDFEESRWKGGELKLALFADDTIFFLANPSRDMMAIYNH